MFVQFNASASFTNHIAELFQYSTFLLLVHSVYGFTFSYLEINARRYHRIAGIFHIVLLAILWSTKLVITSEFTYRNFLWLKNPYIEPELGILGPFFLVYSSLAAAFCMTYWVRDKNRQKSIRWNPKPVAPPGNQNRSF